MLDEKKGLRYLNLFPDSIILPDRTTIKHADKKWQSPSQCFFQTDLYTTFFGPYINDEIEKRLFGELDDVGAKAVRAFISKDPVAQHKNFQEFFTYIDAQKIRTPKGLDWIKKNYPRLDQLNLMIEMQAIRNMNCTIWTEGVREIVSAANSPIKFIVSDHPVTIYNYAFPPDCPQCKYPSDPEIALKGTQTIFPLDMDHCLILTNYEYAKSPDGQLPDEKRTHARNYRQSMVRTDAFIRSRFLSEGEVKKINLIIKRRARRYLAAAKEEWLYPEKEISEPWSELRDVLLPRDGLWQFGGETYVGYKDGTSSYQDAFGRTQPESKHLKKTPKKDPKRNDYCPCGSAKHFKNCCEGKSPEDRPSWNELSIRERNVVFANGIEDILGLNKGKTWSDVRKDLSDDQISKIHELYGFLWPLETDLVSLLPKPDKSSRALYTGIVDPRTVFDVAVNLILYFDEVIIQGPFINPWAIKPEYSPIKSPNQYKIQTIKNIALFLNLMPFIQAGYINFIPDPCAFDLHMRQQIMHMAESRSAGMQISVDDKETMMWLQKEDFIRTLYCLPENSQRRMLRQAIPNISENEIETTLKKLREMALEDPLALLQEDIFTGKGGQLQIQHMIPNFEVSMFLAQVTGAVLCTDSNHRWEEIVKAQSHVGRMPEDDWKKVADLISSKKYTVCYPPEVVFSIRKEGKMMDLRNSICAIFNAIQKTSTPSRNIVKYHSGIFSDSYRRAKKETKKIEISGLCADVSCLMPRGGIVHNNVQRLLLSNMVQRRLNNVPMAIFFKVTG